MNDVTPRASGVTRTVAASSPGGRSGDAAAPAERLPNGRFATEVDNRVLRLARVHRRTDELDEWRRGRLLGLLPANDHTVLAQL